MGLIKVIIAVVAIFLMFVFIKFDKNFVEPIVIFDAGKFVDVKIDSKYTSSSLGFLLITTSNAEYLTVDVTGALPGDPMVVKYYRPNDVRLCTKKDNSCISVMMVADLKHRESP